MRNSSGPKTLTIGLIVAALVGASAPSAGAIPPGGARPSHNGSTVRLSTTTAKPGGTIKATGTKFPAGKQATVKLDDETIIAVLKIDKSGRFSGPVVIPANVLKIVRPGKHWLRFLAPPSSANKQSATSIQKYFTLERK